MRLINVHEVNAGNVRTAAQKLNPDTFQHKANISFMRVLSIDRNFEKMVCIIRCSTDTTLTMEQQWSSLIGS